MIEDPSPIVMSKVTSRNESGSRDWYQETQFVSTSSASLAVCDSDIISLILSNLILPTIISVPSLSLSLSLSPSLYLRGN